MCPSHLYIKQIAQPIHQQIVWKCCSLTKIDAVDQVKKHWRTDSNCNRTNVHAIRLQVNLFGTQEISTSARDEMGNWFSCFSGRKSKNNSNASNGDECHGDERFRVPVERGHPHNRHGKCVKLFRTFRFLFFLFCYFIRRNRWIAIDITPASFQLHRFTQS